MSWLPDMDSNHDRLLQRQPCYRYTIGQDGTDENREINGGVKFGSREVVCPSAGMTTPEEKICRNNIGSF